jgi:muconolactone D-isomerase
MSEYLVHLDVRWPADGDPAQREQIMEAEVARRGELIEQGLLLRLWRDPGRWANWTLWSAADATELHVALSSLPFHPWMRVTVHPLARHEADPGGA